jgi:molecular chaperone DnaK (HSP70)
MPAVGIDLGSSYCCVGVWWTDHVEIIYDDRGDPGIPFFVSYIDGVDKDGRSNEQRDDFIKRFGTDGLTLIGTSAKDMASLDPQNGKFISSSVPYPSRPLSLSSLSIRESRIDLVPTHSSHFWHQEPAWL